MTITIAIPLGERMAVRLEWTMVQGQIDDACVIPTARLGLLRPDGTWGYWPIESGSVAVSQWDVVPVETAWYRGRSFVMAGTFRFAPPLGELKGGFDKIRRGIS